MPWYLLGGNSASSIRIESHEHQDTGGRLMEKLLSLAGRLVVAMNRAGWDRDFV